MLLVFVADSHKMQKDSKFRHDRYNKNDQQIGLTKPRIKDKRCLSPQVGCGDLISSYIYGQAQAMLFAEN